MCPSIAVISSIFNNLPPAATRPTGAHNKAPTDHPVHDEPLAELVTTPTLIDHTFKRQLPCASAAR
ncbi:MAG: hypothetical protein NWE89_00945 [Candidatus Bathyarchaeota archaeon]|nr:hypothetical protein [Candidatus Bathyarchaeota archaeon]